MRKNNNKKNFLKGIQIWRIQFHKSQLTKSHCVFKQVSEIVSYLKFIDILWYKDNGTSAEIPLFDHKG